jgi:hypothetical protein
MKPIDREMVAYLLGTLKPKEFLVVTEVEIFTCKDITYLDDDYISLKGILFPEHIAKFQVEITIPKLNIQLIIQNRQKSNIHNFSTLGTIHDLGEHL